MIRLARPDFGDAEALAVREVLASGQLVQGERVAAFEAALASHAGAEHAVAVNSGTSALHHALLGLGVGPGDVVIVAAYSFVATANVVELCGARPLFVDVRPDTFNLDPEALAVALEKPAADGPVKAILPVHTFGQMADMPEIDELARRHGVGVVEDAACALGSRLGGRPPGSWGHMACYSFHPRKVISTGEGGATFTSDAKLARRLRALRDHGRDTGASPPEFALPGYNNRMTELQAALGLVQLGRLEEILATRRRLAARYDELLEDTSLTTPVVAPGAEHTFQSYVVLLPARLAAQRDDIIAAMKDLGIETGIGTHHLPLTGYYRRRYGAAPGDFPVTDDVFARSLSLPLHVRLTDDDQHRVAAALRELVQ